MLLLPASFYGKSHSITFVLILVVIIVQMVTDRGDPAHQCSTAIAIKRLDFSVLIERVLFRINHLPFHRPQGVDKCRVILVDRATQPKEI